jgi:glycosyltransferase involved in cell wall biosynthesis
MEHKPENQIISFQKSLIPRVSIGMPVYNGEKYIRQALDSVIAQTYTDFELVISDNASSDGTEAICKEYVKKDIRIKYIKQPVNIGAINNFNFLLKQASGIYFAWLCHDDYLDVFFLEMIARFLDEHADVALCASDFYVVKDGAIVRTRIQDHIRDNIDWTVARRGFFTYSSKLFLAFSGIYRLSIMHTNNIYLQPGFNGIIWGDEISVLPRVALHGRIVALPKLLRYERKHDGSLNVTESIPFKPLQLFINLIYTTTKYQAREVFFSKLTIRQKLDIYNEMLSCDVPIIFVYAWECIPIRCFRWLSNINFLHPLRNRFIAILYKDKER